MNDRAPRSGLLPPAYVQTRRRGSKDPRRPLAYCLLPPASCLLFWASPAPAAVSDYVGRSVVEVVLVSHGRLLEDRAVQDLIETRVGVPLSLRSVRESLAHLFSLGRFEDVRVEASVMGEGVVLRYDLVPLQVAERLVFEGDLGLSRGALTDFVEQEFGVPLPIDLAEDVVRALALRYEQAGYLAAQVTSRIVLDPSGRQAMAFDVRAGARARIARVDVRGVSAGEQADLVSRLGLRQGAPYVRADLDRRVTEYRLELRDRRYYDADLRYEVVVAPDQRTVDVTLNVSRGPRITVLFGGDPIAVDPLDELVPIAREGSVDEDLLEDSARRIEGSLHAEGYRDAVATYARQGQQDQLSIVFTIDRGRLFRIGEVAITGNTALPTAEIVTALGLSAGQPFVKAVLDRGVSAVRERYRRLGYARVEVQPVVTEIGRAGSPTPPADGATAMRCEMQIQEGPRTIVSALSLEGNERLSDQTILAGLGSAIGQPYYAPRVADDRDVVRLRYLNDGYREATVTVTPRFAPDFETLALVFSISEGAQAILDHILIVGNQQIETRTIRREIPVREGDPLGADEVVAIQQRLSALALFRRIELREFSHGGGNRRDLVVVVEEAPATRLGYGGGMELSQRLRREREIGRQAVERIEFAPRAFFEIGRRNLWGKNRSIDLFTRISVRRKNPSPFDDSVEPTLGLNEYRVLGTYREPRAIGVNVDLLVTGFTERTIRPSFNLFSRGANVQLQRSIAPTVRASLGYAFGQNRVSETQLAPEDERIVDRLFPSVVLSSVSASTVSDTRDDPFEPTRGHLLGVDGEIAGRRIGSEVGFAKTFLQGFLYRELPGRDRLVFAGGARLGLAVGFPQRKTIELAVAEPGGAVTLPVTFEVRDVPVSERFFAGGDTTVRGFALDRLGDEATIDKNGFPRGGNAMLVLNGELRVPLWGDIGIVGFLDAGNVFARVSEFSLRRIRGSAGFGLRYRSPVGPIRVDVGVKLDRRRFASGELERLTALHVSIGQAF